jgi:uncharacterized protein (TIGR00255 family)
VDGEEVDVLSMTGFVSKAYRVGEYTVTVEVKSLNNKFLELRFRLPPVLDHLEERLRGIVRRFVQRGKVDVYIKLAADEERELRNVRKTIARRYGILERIREETGYGVQASLSDIIALGNLVGPSPDEAEADVEDELVEKVFDDALRLFQDSRAAEGEHARRDMRGYVEAVAASLSRIEGRFPEVAARIREQLGERIRELVGAGTDETRVVMEAGILASKADVSEEVSRMKGHLGKFLHAADAEGPCGRELDFIVQEMGREVNTIGAKVPDFTVAEEVVSMKANLERIREQVRNVE